MRIDRLTGFMGAEISGLDLTRPFSGDLAVALRAALGTMLTKAGLPVRRCS